MRAVLGLISRQIYEKAADVGGTSGQRNVPADSALNVAYQDNIYPSYPFLLAIHGLDPNWPSNNGSQADLQDYWHKLAQNLRGVERRRKSVSYRFAGRARRRVLHNGQDSDFGNWDPPSAALPSIPGLGSFKGEMFHSVRWHASVNLRGKRVAVIGNGVSATQFVPIISGNPSAQVTGRPSGYLTNPLLAAYFKTLIHPSTMRNHIKSEEDS
ncbi:hypothetical protein B0H11DRAFT_1908923 [Mycena galericulata]|nr:hypothetical protein B0H11DRAFT_1908923 [Mycena galericulata]